MECMDCIHWEPTEIEEEGDESEDQNYFGYCNNEMSSNYEKEVSCNDSCKHFECAE